MFKMHKSLGNIFLMHILWWLIYFKLPYFSCFGDKNSSGARLQIDDVLSTSKQRKCF